MDQISRGRCKKKKNLELHKCSKCLRVACGSRGARSVTPFVRGTRCNFASWFSFSLTFQSVTASFFFFYLQDNKRGFDPPGKLRCYLFFLVRTTRWPRAALVKKGGWFSGSQGRLATVPAAGDWKEVTTWSQEGGPHAEPSEQLQGGRWSTEIRSAGKKRHTAQHWKHAISSGWVNLTDNLKLMYFKGGGLSVYKLITCTIYC